ncbi:MAG: hypothetical protein HY534_00175 [Chloroflexi bacterium]|nr:hypothetical protein [Chloroflexota bacterium]
MDESDDTQILTTAVRAARAGGAVALGHLGQLGYVRWKGMRDVEVEAARVVQQAIVAEIQQDFPEHPILAEESDTAPPADADPLWIVDPIDGSLNYQQALPLFAISLAYRRKGIYRVGVVYDPCRDELFQGVEGRGARLNDQPIVVEQVSEAFEAFENAVLGMDLAREGRRRTQSLQLVQMLASNVLALNVMGAPSLGLCYLAAGRLHAYLGLDLDLWDVAGAAVILKEAGGILTSAQGGSWLFADRSYLATNGVLHGEMLRHMTEILNAAPPGPA